MAPLLGIITFHIMILLRTQSSKNRTVPYISVFFLTVLLVAFVAFFMMNTDKPEQ